MAAAYPYAPYRQGGPWIQRGFDVWADGSGLEWTFRVHGPRGTVTRSGFPTRAAAMRAARAWIAQHPSRLGEHDNPIGGLGVALIGAAVIAAGVTIAVVATAKPAAPAAGGSSGVVLNPLNSGQTFQVKTGQTLLMQLPVDPSGVVTYQNNGSSVSPAIMQEAAETMSPDGTMAMATLQAVGPGTVTPSASVLTNGAVTGTIQWTVVVS